MSSPGTYSPFGARAFVRQLNVLRQRGRGPNLTAVLADPSPGETSLKFENEGGQTAVQTAYLLAADTGTDSRQVGDIPPGDPTSVRVSRVTREPVQCVWSCFDGRGRMIVWSYDGRHKRVRHGKGISLGDAFRRMYPT
jgi:hypothetical protein